MPDTVTPEHLEQRVGHIERDVTTMGRQLTEQGARLGQVESGLDRVATGVEKLIDQGRHSPKPTDWRAVAVGAVTVATLIAAGMAGMFWAIANSPAVERLANQQKELLRYVEAVHDASLLASSDRHTGKDELIQCLRNEIENRRIGFKCAHPLRFRQYPDNWRSTIRRASPSS